MKRNANIFEQVRKGLEPLMYMVIPALLPGGKVKGKEYVCGSLEGGPGDSCSTNLVSGVGADFATGERWGDVIDLARQVWNVPALEAAQELAKKYGVDVSSKKGKKAEPRFRPADEGPIYQCVIPVPEHAPELPGMNYQRGEPTAIWCYRDEHGNVLHYIARFQRTKTKKEILPLSLFRHIETGNYRWLWKSVPSPRPLYNLDKLGQSLPSAPVLLVEGEKAADAASALFPQYVCMTWSGGSAMGRSADVAPIEKREVLIWPDNDASGLRGAMLIAETLLQRGNTARILLPPEGLPEKWDVADEAPDGFDPHGFLQSEAYILTDFMELAYERYPSLRSYAIAKPARIANLEEAAFEKQSPQKKSPGEPRVRSWPTLEREALSGLAGEFVSLATRNSEADPAAVLATLLVRFGAEIYAYEGNVGPYVRVGETIHPPRLFAAICGLSSRARKGTSAKPVLRLFEQPALFRNALPAPAAFTGGPLSSGEGLAFRLRNHASDEDSPENEMEAIGDKRLFVLDEELAAALANMRREGNILSMTLRSFWDSGDYEPLTKNQQIRVKGAHVCIVTHITIREVKRSLDHVQMSNGFANRFLWILARRSKLVPRPHPMPEREFSELQNELWKRIRDAQKRMELKFSEQAEHYWAEHYKNLSEDIPGITGEILARSEAQCTRLALLYALLDGSGVIDVAHIASALAVWRYFRDSVLYVFGDAEEDVLAGQVVEILKTGPKSTTDIHAGFNGHVSGKKLKMCLQELIGQRLVHVSEEKPREGRKPYTGWRIKRMKAKIYDVIWL